MFGASLSPSANYLDKCPGAMRYKPVGNTSNIGSFNHMDHKYIDELDLVDRYLMGSLPIEESERFEEHFVNCSRCADQMEANRDLIQGLRLVASHESSEVRGGSLSEPTRYSRHVVSRRWLALASAFLLLVAFVCAIEISRVRRLRG